MCKKLLCEKTSVYKKFSGKKLAVRKNLLWIKTSLFSVKKTSVCTSFSVQKGSMCKRFSVSNLLCGKRRGRLLWRRESVFGAGFQLEESGDDLREELR